MPLYLKLDLRVAAGALKNTTVTNHYGDWRDWCGGEVEKLGQTQLHKIVRTATVNENGETMAADRAVDMKGFGSGHSCHGVQTQMRGRVI